MTGLVLCILFLLAHKCLLQSVTSPPSSSIAPAGVPSRDAEPNIVNTFPKGSCGHVAVDPLPNRGFIDGNGKVEKLEHTICGRRDNCYNSLARPKSIPWIVSIRHRDLDYKHFCGGSLVRASANVEATDIVITTSVCAADFEPDKVYLVAGVYDRTQEHENEQSREYTKIVKHEKYNKRTYENDIAIVKLAKAINFTDVVQPICLPQQGERLDIDTVGLVAGWGKTKEGVYISDEMLQRKILVFNHSSCDTYYRHRYIIYDDLQLCAGSDELGRDGCEGDTGGPFAFKKKQGYTLEGVVSFGGGCGVKRPGFYTRISSYVDWINGKIKELSDIAKQ